MAEFQTDYLIGARIFSVLFSLGSILLTRQFFMKCLWIESNKPKPFNQITTQIGKEIIVQGQVKSSNPLVNYNLSSKAVCYIEKITNFRTNDQDKKYVSEKSFKIIDKLGNTAEIFPNKNLTICNTRVKIEYHIQESNVMNFFNRLIKKITFGNIRFLGISSEKSVKKVNQSIKHEDDVTILGTLTSISPIKIDTDFIGDSYETLKKYYFTNALALASVTFLSLTITYLLLKPIASSLKFEDEHLNEDLKCIICMVGKKQALLSPCNHLCLCLDCVKLIDKCPACRANIDIYHIVNY